MTDSPSLDEQAKEFFYTVGLAITDWAYIDEQLFTLCAAALKSEAPHVAIVYYRTPTLSARLSLVDDLVISVLHKPTRKNGGHPGALEKKWKTLSKSIEAEFRIRNQLAHSPSTPMADFSTPPSSGGPPLMTDVWWASYMSRGERLRGRKGNQKELKIADVKAHLQKVGTLFIELRNFRDEFLRLPR